MILARVAVLVLILLAGLSLTPAVAAPDDATTWAADRDAGTATLVVLGDSISAGAPYCSWPNCWTTRVGWEWSTTNLARSGAQPADLYPDGWCHRTCWYADWGASGIARVGQLQPSAVVIALGAVPYGFIGQHPIDYVASMRKVMDRVRQVSPRSTIVLVHTPGFVASHGLTWVYVDYGRAMDELARTTPNSAYVDLARDLPWGDSDTAGMFSSDRVHPNNAGHVGMAVAMVGALRWL